ncbi:MAG: flippase-like domain-containing protein [Candidatus Eisenbacteria bacterium]|nr:flippase-like domain-containing protein [Candidatus Latescibacterota bacterium]MBD3301821.1 flippase-like domain-containing protein [Candidatus Eisenbacteria bacterium]
MTRSRLLLAAKTILGVGLLALLLFRNDNLSRLGELFARFDPRYLPPLLIVAVLLIVISCLKWHLFLRFWEIRISLLRLIGLYTIGNFFSNFLPSMVGGDFVRGYVLGRRIDSQSRSMASVFLERFTGLIALVVLCVVTLSVKRDLLEHPVVAATAAAMAIGCAAGLFLIARPRAARILLSPLRRTRLGARLFDALERFHREIVSFRDRPGILAIAMVYSFAFHLVAGINTWLAARAIGVDAALLDVVALTPLILLVSSVPLTPNGIGIWEWAFRVYLVSAGAGPAEGLAVALILRAEHIAASLVGGLLFLIERPGRNAGNAR